MNTSETKVMTWPRPDSSVGATDVWVEGEMAGYYWEPREGGLCGWYVYGELMPPQETADQAVAWMIERHLETRALRYADPCEQCGEDPAEVEGLCAYCAS